MKIKLNQRIIDRDLLCPDDKKQIEYCDTELPGLYVLVSRINPGIGTYYVRYKNEAGKTCHKKIARTDIMNLKEARDRAKLLKLEISQGKDPQAEIKQKRKAMTYDTFMMNHYFPYIKPRLRSYGTNLHMYNSRIKKAFGHVKLNMMQKRDVQKFQDDIRSQGLSNAYNNRHIQLLKSSINFGLNILEVIDIKNVAVGLPLLPEESNERYLDSDELAKLMPVLMNDDGQIAKIIRFLLATGLRLGECLNCEWSHIDTDNKVMTISSSRSKSKKTASIPLNAAAIQVLGECSRQFDYPFANHKTRLPFVTPKKGFQKLMKQAGLEGVTAHTLRHTAASMMINAGRSLYDVQKVLRHSSPMVTEKYAHLSQQAIMDASDTISEQLMRAAGNKG